MMPLLFGLATKGADFPMPDKPKKPRELQGRGSDKSSLFSQSGPLHLSGSSTSGTYGTRPGGTHSNPPPPPLGAGMPPPQPQLQPVIPEPREEAGIDIPEEVIREIDREGDRDRWRSIPSPSTTWSPSVQKPRIDSTSYLHPLAVVSGNVIVGKSVFIAGGVLIRGDNDEPVFIGDNSNLQEGVVLRDLPTRKDGKPVTQRIVDVGSEKYSVYIGSGVTISPQAQVHGPAFIADGVFVGMQSLVFWARIESGVVIEPAALVMNVTIPSGVFVPAGLKVTTQRMVRDLPPLTSKYRFHGISEELVAGNLELLRGYKSLRK